MRIAVEAAVAERWNHTAALLALLYNANRDPNRSAPRSLKDFHPYKHKLKDDAIHITTPEQMELAMKLAGMQKQSLNSKPKSGAL